MSDRSDRISEEIRKELSKIFLEDLKDPRMPSMVSVLAVKVDKDLKFAKTHVSVLGDDEAKAAAGAALKSAAGYIRHEISHRLKLRNTPEFHFVIDNSIEEGVAISSLINKVIKADEETDALTEKRIQNEG
ncbi:MAG: 30S ribosome-binding factor RbfA [Bacillota bacterium]